MELPNLKPSDFTYRRTVRSKEDDHEWYQLLLLEFFAEMGLPQDLTLFGGCCARSVRNPDGSLPAGGQVLGGLRIVGRNKHGVIVAFAGFDPETEQVVGWSSDFDMEPPYVQSQVKPACRGEDGSYEFPEIDTALLKRMKAVTGTDKLKKPKEELLAFHHDDRINRLVVSPDQSQIASVSRDKTLRIWDARTGVQRFRKVLATGGFLSLNAVSYSPDGRRLATGTRAIQIFDPRSGELLAKLEGHPRGSIEDLCYSPSGKWLASASGYEREGDNSVGIWDVSTGDLVAKLNLDGNLARAVRFSRDESTLVAMTWVGDDIFAFDLATRNLRARLRPGTSNTFERLAVTDSALVCSADEKLVFLEPESLRELGRVTFPRGEVVQDLEVSPDGQTLAVSLSEWISFMDPRTREEMRRVAKPRTEQLTSRIAFAPSGAFMAVAVEHRIVRVEL